MAYKMYQEEVIYERYRHRFEVNPNYIDKFKESGLSFTGVD